MENSPAGPWLRYGPSMREHGREQNLYSHQVELSEVPGIHAQASIDFRWNDC